MGPGLGAARDARFWGLDAITEKKVDRLHLAMKMLRRGREEVKDVITAGDFHDLSDGAQIIFT
ncbi:MAG: hypothetical protein HS111_25450 [Kofleriaceae bacterium]|nr:hypothetical protein [Kofleriaceae bacterium]MCL4223667.1 hypothetical protein [Myxococcales bacterium]